MAFFEFLHVSEYPFVVCMVIYVIPGENSPRKTEMLMKVFFMDFSRFWLTFPSTVTVIF